MLKFQKTKTDYKRDLTKEERQLYGKQLDNNPLLWVFLDELEEQWYSQFKGTLLPHEQKHYHAGIVSIDRLRSKILQIIPKTDRKV